MKVNIARIIENRHLISVEPFVDPLTEHIANCIKEAGGPLLDNVGLDNLAGNLSATVSLLGDIVNTIERQLAANMREEVLSEVAQELNTDTIAQILVKHLEAIGKPATAGNCQELWLDVVEYMTSNIGNSYGLV
jgi:hypothetical protein